MSNRQLGILMLACLISAYLNYAALEQFEKEKGEKVGCLTGIIVFLLTLLVADAVINFVVYAISLIVR